MPSERGRGRIGKVGPPSRGRISKSGSSRGSSTRESRTTRCKPYKAPEIPISKSVFFDTVKDWENWSFVPGHQKHTFCEDFDTADAHLDAIIAKGPSVCHPLQHLESGDEDTGKGSRISDEAVSRLAEAAPNLIYVSLPGAKGLTDASLGAFFTHCPHIRYTSINGNDKISGEIKGTALDMLRERLELGKALDTLRLIDQSPYNQNFDKAVKKLSMARKNLAIQIGCTMNEA
ncbi:MAG: hypothetical protein Q9170_006557 [Blastenia crenularia]